MKGLLGCFTAHSDELGRTRLERMLSASPTAALRPELCDLAPGAIGIHGGEIARPRLVEAGEMVLAVQGHPRLLHSGQRIAAASEIASAIETKWSGALPDIVGDFALAAWNRRTRRGLLATDRLGIHPLVYASIGQGLVFASSLDMLAASPGVARRLSRQAVYDYLFYHVCPGPQTIYEGLHRLPPGAFVEFGGGRVEGPTAYWAMRFSEAKVPSLEDLEHRFRSTIEASVAEAAEGAAVGAFLSGGTDSSTISGMLCRVGQRPADVFSIGFDVAGYDEMDYARTAARHFGCRHHEYYVTPDDVVDAVPKIAAAYDQPFGNASAIPTYYCARLAREHGIERLLAGDGGDELFGGNERYAKQQLLGYYERVPEGIRRRIIEPAMVGSRLGASVPGWRKLRSYVEQARPPMPLRYLSYNLLSYLGPAEVLDAGFRTTIDEDHPRKLLLEAHAPFSEASLVNQMLGIDLRFTLNDGDLPKVSHTCELAGVDVAYPLLDDRVLDFSAQLPSSMKLRGTQLRWFFKHALRDFLPQAVLTKQKHGFGLPVGAWLTGHEPLRKLAIDSIQSLRPFGIVRPQFIDELLGAKLREHPAYFGTMVWILMMLGLWLDSRQIRA